jgi:hypothetical protein
MRTMSRIPPASPARSACRVPIFVVVLGILALSGATATWGGVSARIVLPVAAAVLAIVLFLAARRALREASARIDAILGEELGPAESPSGEAAEAESAEPAAVAESGEPAGQDWPNPRQGLDDARLGSRARG